MDYPTTTGTLKQRAHDALLDEKRAQARKQRITIEAMRQEAASIVAHAVREILGDHEVQMGDVASTVRRGITEAMPIIEAWINIEGLSFRWAAEVTAVESRAQYRASRIRGDKEPVALAVYSVCDQCGADVFLGDISSLRDLAIVMRGPYVCPECLPPAEDASDEAVS